jgi:hypothetical protein
MKLGLSLGIITLSILLVSSAAARAQSGCAPTNGNRFNLEPRPNAVVQAAQSVAFLPNRVAPNTDLVVATATDMRGLASSTDDFYVQRSNANCSPDFEGGLPFITNIFGTFAPFGTPIAIADRARDAFFIVDLRFSGQNGVGIVRTTAANLLSPTACPNGTQLGSASCWPIGAVTNITGLNEFLSSPHIAVDPRKTGVGTGAGDLYTVVTQRVGTGLHTKLTLTACTNAILVCGSSITISGSDLEADFGYIQVRSDGIITISYRDTTFPGVNPETIKFVTCTPNGAPKAPTCGSPAVVTTENHPVFASLIGDVPMFDQLYPRHVNRLESDGKTVTTFLVYDRCDVAVIQQVGLGQPFCPKTDVVFTSSSNGGISWSPVTKITPGTGQQFFANVALDESTSTVNMVYYSTENDFFKLHAQVLLAQILPTSTTVETPQLLTSDFADPQASPPLTVQFQPAGFGDRLGLAAAGTGTDGQSRAYIGFTWNSVFGTYGGVPSADVNNHLTKLEY